MPPYVDEARIGLLGICAGGRRGPTGQYEAGRRLFDHSPSNAKHFFEVEGAGHYDMYYKPEYVGPAVAKLAEFFSEHLAP
ncbi:MULTISPECIES: alpha/beta hydrolase family protein [Agrobacterium]|uniref:hypothetical protein n=1 Tax=Agrobacterium TaxID=357 RepID=UPI0009CF7350